MGEREFRLLKGRSLCERHLWSAPKHPPPGLWCAAPCSLSQYFGQEIGGEDLDGLLEGRWVTACTNMESCPVAQEAD